jgi:hypothetical protein
MIALIIGFKPYYGVIILDSTIITMKEWFKWPISHDLAVIAFWKRNRNHLSMAFVFPVFKLDFQIEQPFIAIFGSLKHNARRTVVRIIMAHPSNPCSRDFLLEKCLI